MIPTPPRVVFDSVVFVQALIGGRGPAAACIERVLAGEAILFLSDAIRAEMNEVPLRPELTARYPHLNPPRVKAFVQELDAVAVLTATPPIRPLPFRAIPGTSHIRTSRWLWTPPTW